MIASKLRTGATRFLRSQRGRVLPTASSLPAAQVRFISSEDERKFQEMGYLDEDGLTVFDTLHEMQQRACAVYSENEIFGTYQEDTNSFEYITYSEYNDRIDKARSVLKSLGEFH